MKQYPAALQQTDLMPRVSVLILTYNRPEFISRAIQSVIDQRFEAWEVIVVHDGTDERTPAIMHAWQQRDRRIRYFQREQAGNIADATNFGLRHAAGEYIAILDDDDYWIDPVKLQDQVRFLDENPSYVGCGGGMIAVDQHAQEILRCLKPQSDELIKRRALLANPMVNSTALYRRSTAEQVGGYDAANLSQFQDWDFWLKMGLAGKLYNAPQYLTYYSIWDTSSSFRHLKKNSYSALKIVWRYRHSYSYFGTALTLAVAYCVYAHLPEFVRAVSFGFLTKLKKSIFAKRPVAPTAPAVSELPREEEANVLG